MDLWQALLDLARRAENVCPGARLPRHRDTGLLEIGPVVEEAAVVIAGVDAVDLAVDRAFLLDVRRYILPLRPRRHEAVQRLQIAGGSQGPDRRGGDGEH